MIQIVECEQSSGDWFRARAGIPTASEFSAVLANGKGGGESKTRRAYMLRLAGEIITGEIAETYCSADMERGRIMEPEARDMYAFTRKTDLRRVGFIRGS